MGPDKNQSIYELLDERQQKDLNDIIERIVLSGPVDLDHNTGDQVIEILESWLMDDEQKQNLKANVWDIFFLHAAAGLISLDNPGGFSSLAANAAPENLSENARTPPAAKTNRVSLDISDRQKAAILESIGTGYISAGNMAEEIPPRVADDNGNYINV